MSKQKKIGRRMMEWLQKEIDAFCSKLKENGVGVKVIAGFMTALSLSLLVSCSSEPAEEIGDYELVSQNGMPITHFKKDEVAERELKLEAEIAKYLSEKTGVNVEVIDMREINLVKSSDNYLIITGEMINDVKVGTRECTVTLRLSDEQFEKMQKAMARYIYVVNAGAGTYSYGANYMDDTVAIKYERSFLSVLDEILDDPETAVEVIYDADLDEWLYERPDPVVPKK